MLMGIVNEVLSRRIRASLILIALLLLSACSTSLFTQQRPPVSSYLLEWNDALALPATAHNTEAPSIRLSLISAAAGFDGPQIIYIRTPHQLEYYRYHRWVEAPARMLEPLLMQLLEGGGLFSAVLGPDSAVRADLQLDAELLHLQQVFSHGGSEVQLALSVNLVDAAQAQLIASQRFSIIEPVIAPTPYGSVQAANRATARLLIALRDFIAHQPPLLIKD